MGWDGMCNVVIYVSSTTECWTLGTKQKFEHALKKSKNPTSTETP